MGESVFAIAFTVVVAGALLTTKTLAVIKTLLMRKRKPDRRVFVPAAG